MLIYSIIYCANPHLMCTVTDKVNFGSLFLRYEPIASWHILLNAECQNLIVRCDISL